MSTISISDTQIQLYLAIGLFTVVLIALIIIRAKKSPPVIVQYEEVFQVENEIYETSPYKKDPDATFDIPTLRKITLTLITGLSEHIAKMAESPSDQHKSMAAIAEKFESDGISPIAYTQWNQSPIQGIAARIILNGKSRTALFGPSVAMAKSSSAFVNEISIGVEEAHSAGHSVFVLAIDGLAYGAISVSHGLQEVAAA